MLVRAPIAAYTFIHLLSWHYSYLEVGRTITLDYGCQVNVGLGSYKSSSAGYLCAKIELPHWCHMLPYLMTSVDAEMPKKYLCAYKMDLSVACIYWQIVLPAFNRDASWGHILFQIYNPLAVVFKVVLWPIMSASNFIGTKRLVLVLSHLGSLAVFIKLFVSTVWQHAIVWLWFHHRTVFLMHHTIFLICNLIFLLSQFFYLINLFELFAY